MNKRTVPSVYRRAAAIFLTVAMFAAALCVVPIAAEETSGDCGANGGNVTWEVKGTVLTIKGTGAMTSSYNNTTSPAPWQALGITEAIIEQGVTSVGNYAFYDCETLQKVSLPATITGINSGTFWNCRLLDTITIPDTVGSIGAYAFRNCESLPEAVIPENVTVISYCAFNGCKSLASLTFKGEKIVTIDGSAFLNCSALPSITLPKSLKNINANAFSGCTGLTEVLYKGTETDWKAVNVAAGNNLLTEKIKYEEEAGPGGEDIDSHEGTCGAGANAEKVTWSLENGILTIQGSGQMASYDTTSNPAPWAAYKDQIKTVTVDEGVTSIGSYAFYNCDALTDVALPDSLTILSSGAFGKCASLKAITIPKRVTDINLAVFMDCKALQTVTFLGQIAKIEGSAFQNCEALTDFSIPNTVSSIGNAAFMSCKSLTEVNIPRSVKTIGSSAFQKCEALTKVTLPKSLNFIDSYAFLDDAALTTVTYAGSEEDWYRIIVKAGSSSLTKHLQFNAKDPTDENADDKDAATAGTSGNLHWSLENGTLTFSGTGPMANYDNTANPAPWRAHGDLITKVVVEKGVTSIGNYAFRGCVHLQTVQLAEGVTAIGAGAFWDCDALTEIHLPSQISRIDTYAFYNCIGLSEITIPENVTTISSSCFFGCNALTKVTLNEKITSLGMSAFQNCKNLAEINLPSTVTEIGNYAFLSCLHLDNLTIPAGVTRIGNQAFQHCAHLCNVTYLGTEEQWKNINMGTYNTALQVALTPKDAVEGDITGDGVASIEDVTALLVYLSTPRNVAAISLSAEDVDLTGDGAVTIKDVSRLLHYLEKAGSPVTLNGKTALFCGDSITAASVYDADKLHGWAGRIARDYQLTYTNSGVDGASVSECRGANRILTQLENGQYGAYNYVILHGMTNDAWDSAPVGKMTAADCFDRKAFDTSTFAGALEELFYYAREYYANAKIGYIINFRFNETVKEANPTVGRLNDMQEYVDVAKQICQKWGVPYLDLYNNDAVYNALAPDAQSPNFGDKGIHPNAAGYDILYPYIADFMKTLR